MSTASLREAALAGDLDRVNQLLLDPSVDPAAVDNYAIRFASLNGHLPIVERLLQDERVDPAAGDNFAIRWASRDGHLSVVERLLQDKRVDPAANDNAAIRYASQNGHFAVVERILQDERVDPSASDNFAIRRAAYKAHSAVVDRLLQDERVDPAALHRTPQYYDTKQYAVSTLTDAMLPRLALTLSLPFPADSCIVLWQPRLRQYRHHQIRFLQSLIAAWQYPRSGVSYEIVEDVVAEYVLGRRLHLFAAMDAEYRSKGRVL
jgi:hypothetical protein